MTDEQELEPNDRQNSLEVIIEQAAEGSTEGSEMCCVSSIRSSFPGGAGAGTGGTWDVRSEYRGNETGGSGEAGGSLQAGSGEPQSRRASATTATTENEDGINDNDSDSVEAVSERSDRSHALSPELESKHDSISSPPPETGPLELASNIDASESINNAAIRPESPSCQSPDPPALPPPSLPEELGTSFPDPKTEHTSVEAEEEVPPDVVPDLSAKDSCRANSSTTSMLIPQRHKEQKLSGRSSTLTDLNELSPEHRRLARVTRRCKSQTFVLGTQDRENGEIRYSLLNKAHSPRSPEKRTSMSIRTPRVEVGETWKALKESVDRLDEKAVEQLLKAGVSANMPHDGSYNEPCYVTVLHSLCNRLVDPSGAPPEGSLAILKCLLDADANVNPRSSVGCTPLMRACVRKNFEAARLLVDRRADIHVRDDAGFDALRLAIRLDKFGSSCGSYDESFAMRGWGSVRAMDHQSKSLCPEAMAEEMYTFRTAVPAPACTKAQDGAVSGQIVRLLLDALECQESESPVGSPSCSPGPRKIGSVTRGDFDPLGFAIENGEASPVSRSIRTAHTPLLDAVLQQNHEAASIILAKGAQPHHLRQAVASGCTELVRVLLEFRADPMEEDLNGETAMDVALQRLDDQSILDLLREAATTREINFDAVQSHTRAKKTARRTSVFSSKSGAKSRSSLSQGVLDLLQATQVPWWKKGWRSWKTSMEDFYEDNLADSVNEFSKNCRWIVQQRAFQTAMCVCLFGALFLADTWVLLDVTNDAPLDVILISILFGFLVEMVLNIVGYREQYWRSFFFYMDIIGAFSLLFDLSFAREFSNNDGHARTVVMRAARAAKLGARAGRFTKLVKMLRFLPGVGVNQNLDDAHVGTAKGMTRQLNQQLSVRVSCIIILMVVLFPVFNIVSYPGQDWSMALWSERLSTAVNSGIQSEFDEVLQDALDFFNDMSYFPFQVRHGHEVLWQRRSPLREANRIKYEKDGVTVMYDFANPNRVEAATNFAMVCFTISLMMGFSLLLSHSVSTIGLIPLELVLARVTLIGKTIYNKVEYIQRELRDCSSISSFDYSSGDYDLDNISRMGFAEDEKFANDETRLLETVIKKIAALGEITIKKAKPNDHETLMYLGEIHFDYQSSKIEAEEQQYNLRGSLMTDLAGDLLLLEDEPCGSLVGSWEFSPFHLDAAQSRGVCTEILGRLAIKAVPELSRQLLQTFVAAACLNHQQEPQYHNWYHAVDVMHTLVLVLHECSRQSVFLSWLEEYGLIVSAICHDLGHPGVNNEFLVQTQHELAMRYNDTSPLENMHCACLFEIVRDPRSAIFGTLSKEKFKEVRAVCIEAILHTDNIHHVPMVKKLQMYGEVNSEILDRAQRAFHQSSLTVVEECVSKEIAWPTRELADSLWEPDARRMLRPALLHFADIANPIKPFALCKEWAVRVLEEFFAQGDMEKEAGLPVQPLNDRSKVNQPFSQVSFIEFFVAPLVFAMVRILAPIEDRIQVILTNTHTWIEEWIDETNASTEEAQGVLGRLRRLEERAPRTTELAISPRHNARHSTVASSSTSMSIHLSAVASSTSGVSSYRSHIPSPGRKISSVPSVGFMSATPSIANSD